MCDLLVDTRRTKGLKKGFLLSLRQSAQKTAKILIECIITFEVIFKSAVFRSSHPEVFLPKRCSKNMQQIYRRTPTPKCDFNSNFIEITLRHGYSPVNFLHIFRTPFLKNTSGRLLLGISYVLVVNIKSVGVI